MARSEYTDSSTPTPLRVLVLTRKSQGDNEETHADQERICRDYIERDPSLVFADVWNEHKVSGAKDWRKRKIGAAVAAVEAGEFDCIMHAWEDRISREGLEAAIAIWKSMSEAGAVYISADGVDSRKEDAEDFFHLKSVLANMQLKRYRKGSNMGRERAVLKHGAHGGRIAPLGYKFSEREGGERNKNGAVLHGPLVESDQAETMRKVFAACGAEEGWLMSWSDVRAATGSKSTGAALSLLTNRVYLGEARSGEKAIKKDAHPALVSVEVFDRIQFRLGERAKDYAVHARGPAQPLALAKVLRCSSCGNVLTPDRTKRRGKVYVSWRCKKAVGKTKGTTACVGCGSVADTVALPWIIGAAQAWHSGSHASWMLGRAVDDATRPALERVLMAAQADVLAAEEMIGAELPAGSKQKLAVDRAFVALREHEAAKGWVAQTPEAVAEMLAEGDVETVNGFLRQMLRVVLRKGGGRGSTAAERAMENRVDILYLDNGLTSGGESPETFIAVPGEVEAA